MNSRQISLAVFVVASSLAVAACGGSGSGTASAPGSTTATTTVAGAAGAQTAFRECLKQHGVDLPAGFGNRAPGDRPNGGSGPPGGGPGGFPGGGSGFPGGGPGGFPGGAAGGKFQKALEACRGSLPAGGFGGGRGGANPQQLEAYLSCLRDHGVKVPARTPGTTPGTASGSAPRGNPALRAVQNDPKFAAANKTCRPLLPTFGSANTTTTAG